MNESRGEAFARIAKDERIMGLDRADARQHLRVMNSWEHSIEERTFAAKSIIRIARNNRLDSLADAAEGAQPDGPEKA